MRPEFLSALILPWLAVAGYTSLVAEKYGFQERIWFLASIFSGPVAWILLYLKVRDRKERVGPGEKRSGSLAEISARKRRRKPTTIR